MRLFDLWEQLGGIICYHGSRKSGLIQLKGFFPKYKGSLGFGVYVGLHPKTAEFYGNYVYKCKTKFDWNSAFSINNDNYGEVWWHLEGQEGYSILTGEHIPPFFFKLKNQIYFVNEGMDFEHEYENALEINLDDIGAEVKEAGYKAVYVEGIRFYASVNEEMLIFDENDLITLEQVK